MFYKVSNTVIILSLVLLHTVCADDCTTKTTCGECVTTPFCAWCLESIGHGRHCYDVTVSKDVCSHENVLYNQLDKITLVDSHPLWFEPNHVAGTNSQIMPQHMKIFQRGGSTATFDFTVSIAENAIDLYYLIDLTTFQKEQKYNLIRLGKRLVSSLEKLSKNIRVGLGVISTPPDVAPCRTQSCENKIQYIHMMKLSQDTAYFNELISNITIPDLSTVNTNSLDGLMQGVVCENSIGWRRDARRILVFSTSEAEDFVDQSPANNGGFFVEQYCHLDAAGYYDMTRQSEDITYDLVQHEAQKRTIGLVVALPKQIYRIHRMHNDSDNVVNIVQHQYESIKSNVVILNNATLGVNFRVYTTCSSDPPQLNPQYERDSCQDVMKGDVIKFKAQITMPVCESGQEWQQTFTIQPQGIGKEALQVDLSLVCKCPCEKEDNTVYFGLDDETTISQCNGRGKEVCGTCDCDAGYQGEHCEVSATHVSSGSAGCPPCPNDCGPNGRCNCGRCGCFPGYVGEDCSRQCPSGTRPQCLIEDAKEECSGNGVCECEGCNCNLGYSGRFCEKCLTCPDECENLKNCVLCEAHKTGPIQAPECRGCSPVVFRDEVEAEDDNVLCTFTDEDDCEFKFIYKYAPAGFMVVEAEINKTCPDTSTEPSGFWSIFK